MAQPLGSGLRPARRSGLTSPEQVTHPKRPAGHPEPQPPSPEPRTSRRTGQRQETHAPIKPENPNAR